jgi:Predicted sugar phosphatases of the HAD superfamily
MKIKNVICDIDGVLLHDNTPVPGADLFLARIQEQGMPLVVLTNYPSQTAQDLANRFAAAGLEVPDERVLYLGDGHRRFPAPPGRQKSLRGRRRRPDP